MLVVRVCVSVQLDLIDNSDDDSDRDLAPPQREDLPGVSCVVDTAGCLLVIYTGDSWTIRQEVYSVGSADESSSLLTYRACVGSSKHRRIVGVFTGHGTCVRSNRSRYRGHSRKYQDSFAE